MTFTESSDNRPSSRLEELGAASAGIIHDLNNQLMLILNHLETGNLSGARHAVQLCTTLTGDLLDYCRDARPVLRATDLSRLVATAAPGFKVPASICLQMELEQEGSPVLADWTGVTRVLHNLVSNAVAAMGHSGAITISTRGNELRVSDTGPGIPLENRKRIFEPFYSTKATRTAEGGTGLGLAIVQEVMRQHGGSVELHSVPGKGATFTLRFRFAPAR